MSVMKILHISMLCVVFLMISFVLADTSIAGDTVSAITFSGTGNTDGTGNTGSSSSGGGGGGGGGGGSNEPPSNIEINQVEYIQKVVQNTPVDFSFTKPRTPVIGIAFSPVLTPSKEVEVRVQQLYNRSVFTTSDAPGTPYKHLNIITGLSAPKEIKDTKVRFMVPKAWMAEKGITSSDIVLQRWNNGVWNILPTSVVQQTDNGTLFEAETPGFSPFTISMMKKGVGQNKDGSDNNGINVDGSGAPAGTTGETPQQTDRTATQGKGLPASGFATISLIMIVTATAMRYKK